MRKKHGPIYVVRDAPSIRKLLSEKEGFNPEDNETVGIEYINLFDFFLDEDSRCYTKLDTLFFKLMPFNNRWIAHESRPFTFGQLAERLVDFGLTGDFLEGMNLVPELLNLKIRESPFPQIREYRFSGSMSEELKPHELKKYDVQLGQRVFRASQIDLYDSPI